MIVIFPELANIIGICIVYLISKNSLWQSTVIFGTVYSLWIYYVFVTTIVDLKIRGKHWKILKLFTIFNIVYVIYITLTFINILIYTNILNSNVQALIFQKILSELITLCYVGIHIYYLINEDYKVFGNTFLIFKIIHLCLFIFYTFISINLPKFQVSLNCIILSFIILNALLFIVKVKIQIKAEFWMHRKNLNKIFDLVISKRKSLNNLDLSNSLDEAKLLLNSATVRRFGLSIIRRDLIKVLKANNLKNLKAISDSYIKNLSKEAMQRSTDYYFLPKWLIYRKKKILNFIASML